MQKKIVLVDVIYGLLLVFILIISTSAIKGFSVWEIHFYENGPIVALYNLLRVILAFLVAISCYSAGRFVVRLSVPKLDLLIIRLYVGASILSILGVATSLWLTVSYPLSIFIFTVLLFIAPHYIRNDLSNFSINRRNKNTILRSISVVLFTLICIILIGRGIIPDLTTNDYAHYLPYYEMVQNNQSTQPNGYFYHFFYSKGAGLIHLTAAISDIHIAQLINIIFISLISLTLYRIAILLLRPSGFVGLASVFALLASPLLLSPLYKSHAQVASLVFYLLYCGGLFYFIKKAELLRLTIYAGIAVVAVTVMSPPITAFTSQIIFLQFLFALALRRGSIAKSNAILGGVIICSFSAILLLNYSTSGLFEITPMQLFYDMRNDLVLREWLSPATISSQILIGNKGSFVWRGFSINANDLYSLAIISLTIFLVFFFRKYLGRITATKSFIISLPALACLISVNLSGRIIVQSSFPRYVIFHYAALILLGLALISAFSNKMPILINKFIGQSTYDPKLLFKQAASFVVVSVSIIIIFNSYTPFINRIPFIYGSASYADFYGTEPNCKSLDLSLPKGTRIVHLNFTPPCYTFPNVRFQRPVVNDFNKDFDRTLFGSADEIREVYKKHNIKYFLIDFGRGDILSQVYSELFSLDNLPKYFRVRQLSPTVWLMTINGTDADGISPNDDFLNPFTALLKSEEKYRFYIAWLALKDEFDKE